VDDLDINLKIAQGLLAPYRMQLTICKDGSRAVELIGDSDFDLILMDCMMPGMDGMEAVRIIRSLGDKYRTVPVIAMTANTASGIREELLARGFDDYLSKPVETHRLNAFLEHWVPEAMRRPTELSEYVPLDIEGLDENRGLANCFYSRDEYYGWLRLYCGDMDARLASLRAAAAPAARAPAPEAGETRRNIGRILRIIKSASATVGALALAGRAEELEKAAAAGQTGGLSSFAGEIDAFRQELLRLLPASHE
jgi:CheY-like chemotaxis protein